MKKFTIAMALFLSLGLMLTSCENTAKGAKKDAKEVGKEINKDAKKVSKEVKKDAKAVGDEVKKDAKKVGEAVDKGVDKTKEALAINDYQCPMKCEGDKVYHEAGKCPKCKMALKKIDSKKKH
jgi:predicted small secreted protein